MPKLSRRFAIADIHGCYYSFIALLDQIQLTKSDQLFLLGDYINRGQHSAKVLDHIMHLMNDGYQVSACRGNHEQQFILAYENGKEFLEMFLTSYKSLDLLNDRLSDYVAFCRNLPCYFISDDCFLSHCGVSIETPSPMNDIRLMFSNAQVNLDIDQIIELRSIHGHRTQALNKIQQAIIEKSKVINLDGGCVYKTQHGLGHLCALDLDSNQLHIQENID